MQPAPSSPSQSAAMLPQNTPPALARPGAAAARIAGLDALKALAVLAAVGIHAPPSLTGHSSLWSFLNQVFRFGVPCLFMASGYFFLRSWQAATNKPEVLGRYGKRLLIPFVFWALFYAVVPPFVGQAQDWRPAVTGHLWAFIRYPHYFLLGGFVYHLWFLSSLGQALLVLWLCLRFWKLQGALLLGGALYVMALCGDLYAVTPLGFQTRFYMRDGPFFSTLFVALGAWLADSHFRCRPRTAAALAGAGFLLHWTEVWLVYRLYGVPCAGHNFAIGTVPYAMGLTLLALAIPDLGPFKRLAWLGTFSLGIYAFHPYLIEVFLRVSEIASPLRQPFLFEAFVAVGSSGLAMGLSKLPWTRKLVS